MFGFLVRERRLAGERCVDWAGLLPWCRLRGLRCWPERLFGEKTSATLSGFLHSYKSSQSKNLMVRKPKLLSWF